MCSESSDSSFHYKINNKVNAVFKWIVRQILQQPLQQHNSCKE